MIDGSSDLSLQLIRSIAQPRAWSANPL